MRYYLPTHLSENIHETPEGYLLCPGVAIARTGTLEYAADDVPHDVAAGREVVLVYREDAEVFAPRTIASFEGKPVTIDHPEEFMSPENWKELSTGHIQNVRRGAGSEADLLLADLIIMDAEAIELVRGGLRELSCGYDAEFDAVSPGVGRQKDIIGNHLAIVRKGRSGSRCAIKDSEEQMKAKKVSFFDRLFGHPKVRKAMQDAAEEEMNKEGTPTGDEDPSASPSAPQAATDEGQDALQQSLDEIKLLLRTLVEQLKPQTQDEDAKACDNDDLQGKDSDEDGTLDSDDPAPEKTATDSDDPPADPVKTGDRHRLADAATVRMATALAPDLRFRVGDSALAVKRAALRTAFADAAIDRVGRACLGNKTLDSAPTALVDAAFVAAAEVAALRNNRRTVDGLSRAKSRDSQGATVSPSSINSMNAQFYAKK